MNTVGSKRPRESDVQDAPAVLDAADVASGGVAGSNDANPGDASTAMPAASASRKKAKTDAEGGVGGENVDEAVAHPSLPSTALHPVDSAAATDAHSSAAATPAKPPPPPRRAQRKSALAAKNKIIAAEATADEAEEDIYVKAKAPAAAPESTAASSATAEQQAAAATAALALATNASASASTKASSTKLVPPPVVQRSRGRGGDRIPEGQTPPTVSSSAAAALAALHPQDPNNPYMLPYPHMGMMHPAMIPPNPYLPPPPPGSYPMFSPGMMPGPGGYSMIPPGFQIPGQQGQQPPGQEGANAGGENGAGAAGQNANGGQEGKEGEAKEGGTGSAGEGGQGSNEANANGGEQGKNTNGEPNANGAAQHQPPHHPYAYVYPPHGYGGHVMPAPEYLPNPNDPNAPQHQIGVHPHHHPHPLPHMQMIPPMTHHAVPNPTGTHHPPHPALHQTHHHPGMASAMQLTLPLAVTDSALPSHLDALIRAPDSLTVTYMEVPDGAYLLRSDFGEPYPKQLEPPRKVTEIRCLFCKRHYSGPNARGMWRRHVTGKHDFAFERKPGGGGGGSGHGGSRVGGRSAPITMDDDDDEGGEGGASGVEGNNSMNLGEDGMGGQGGQGPMNLEGMMGMGGLMSMNGLPVPGTSTQAGQQHPGGNNPTMHFGPVPILHPPMGPIPPHPGSNLDNPNKKRGGVGAGNGGGGVVPRVHPLLTKEERIERARASKRHYAMKRRALEKMKQGGIPKGARLENGVFILTDGTQIPADPSVEYKDLSVKPGGGLSNMHGGTIGADDDDDDDDDFGGGSGVKKPKARKKGKGRASRTSKKEIADDDDDEDDDEEGGHPGDESGMMGDVSMGPPGGDGDTSMTMGDLALMGHHGLVQMDGGQMNMMNAGGGPGISVDMDPWGDPNAAAVMYAASQQHQEQQRAMAAAAAAASSGLAGKLAEIPIVNRGSYKLSPVPHPDAQDSDAGIIAEQNVGFPSSAQEDFATTGPAPGLPTTTKPATRRSGRKSGAIAAPAGEDDQDDGAAEASRASLRRAGLRTRGEKKEPGPVYPPDAKPIESAVTSATVGAGTAVTLPPGIIPPGEDEPERTFCYCNDVEYGNMIGCDNGPNCSREWFHLACTDIEGPIPTRWFCRDCRNQIAEESGPAPADASMETGASSVPSAVVIPGQEGAQDPAAEDGGRPRRRTTRISKTSAAPLVEAPPSKAPPKRVAATGGKKRGRKSKAGGDKTAGDDDIDELVDDGGVDDVGTATGVEGQAGANDVESEDELPAGTATGGNGLSHETPSTKPISSAKATEAGRSRRSTRGHPQAGEQSAEAVAPDAMTTDA